MDVNALDSLLQDLRFAMRSFARSPTMTLIALLTLALGIGANSAIFSLVNGILLQPLPIDAAERVVRIDRQTAEGHLISVSIPTFRDWDEQTRVFRDLGAYRGASANLTGEGDPARLVAAQVTSGFFRTLGRQPILGRVFGEEADEPGAAREVILREDLWQGRFGGDPEIIGRTLRLDGEPFEVIGVMPADMIFPFRTVQLWAPLGAYAALLPWENRDASPGLYALGRLEDGVTEDQVRDDLDAVTARIAEVSGRTEAVPRTRTLREITVGSVQAPLFILLGAVGFVLLIACANVANLLLAKGTSRQLELATRIAIGAGRARVVRQLLVESLLLAASGGMLGLAVGALSLRTLVDWLAATTPLVDRVTIDPLVLGFTALVALLTGVLFGIAPALRFSRPDISAVLHQGVREGGRRSGMRNAVVVAELTLAMVLLVSAGLMLKSFVALRGVDPGFHPDGVLTLRVALPDSPYGETERWTGFFDQLLERGKSLPGVEHLGINNGMPLSGSGSESSALPEGVEVTMEAMVSCLFQIVSADYFQTMGIPLLHGRSFDDRDRADSPFVTAVDESLAERFWPGESAIGKRVAFEFDMSTNPPTPTFREVVAVVGHVRHYELETASRIELYVPFRQLPTWDQGRGGPTMTVYASTSVDPHTLAGPLRALVREIDPDQPVFAVQTMSEVVDLTVAQDRVLAQLLLAFSVLALVLSVVGIYGVMSWAVSERTREIGMRMALGAQRQHVLGMVMGQVALLVGLGIGLGLLSALGLSRFLASSLYGVTATDPVTYGAVALVLAAAALLASLVPAMKASGLDPLEALRHE